MNIDERLEAVAMNLELLTRDVQDLKGVVRQDAESILHPGGRGSEPGSRGAR